MAFPARDVHDWFDEDGEEDELPPPNQLALVPPEADEEQEAPLLPPSALNVSGHIPKGSTRKVSCGLCRNCLFSPAQACLATKTGSQLASRAASKQQTAERSVRAGKVERRLKAGSSEAPLASGSGLGKLCRFCRQAGHTSAHCPVQRLNAEDPPSVRAGAEATAALSSDAALRRVLLCVQQLAAAQLMTCGRLQMRRRRFCLGPGELHLVQTALLDWQRKHS